MELRFKLLNRKEIKTEIINSTRCLQSGGIFLYPTDTVWGLGCSALIEKAVDGVYKIKERAESKSLILLVETFDRLEHHVGRVSNDLLEALRKSDRPTTVIYCKVKNLPNTLLAENGSVAIRLVKHEFCRKLISQLDNPIVSTSANISGQATPQSFDEIPDRIKDQVDYIVNPLMFYKSEDKPKKPSKIIRLLEDGRVEVIRE